MRGKQAAVHVREAIGPRTEVAGRSIGERCTHRAEQFGEHHVRVRGIAGAHLRDGSGEQPLAVEDVGIFGEETEDQPGHKVVQIRAARGLIPLRVFLQQFDVQAIEATGSLDIKGIFTDLLDRCDPRQQQEKPEVVVKVGILAGDGLAIDEIFGLKARAVGGKDEFGFVASGGRAITQGRERRSHLAIAANVQVNIVALEHAAGQIRLVRAAAVEPFKGRLLISEGFEKGKREHRRVKGRFGKPGDGFFNFNGIHMLTISGATLTSWPYNRERDRRPQLTSRGQQVPLQPDARVDTSSAGLAYLRGTLG